MATKNQIETVARHYLVALLWTMPGDDNCENPGDAFYVDGLSDSVRETARTDCVEFIDLCEKSGGLFTKALDCHSAGYGQHPDAGSAEAAFGHDYALTRNGHGCGFWDRASEGLPQELGDAITALCRHKETNLYVGDDGAVYFE